MPHTADGRIYIDTSTNPYTGIDIIRDIAYVFGVNSGDLGEIVSQANVNRWAKYKFVKYRAVNNGHCLTGKTLAPNSDYWRAGDGCCGLIITTFTEIGDPSNTASFIAKLISGQLEWEYDKPAGGLYPLRILDVDGYIKTAENPIGDLEVTDYWLSNQGNMQIDFDLVTVGSDNLAPSDIRIGGSSGTPLSSFYPGIVFWKNSAYHIVTASSVLGSNAISIPIADARGLVGEWNVLPFLSSVQISLDGQLTTGVYLSLDKKTPTVITIHAAGTIIDIFVNAVWNLAGTEITCEAVIRSSSSAAVTIANLQVRLVSTTSPTADPSAGTAVANELIGAVTVPANGEVTRNITIAGLTRNQALTYWVYASSDGGYAPHYNQVEDSPDMPDI